VKEKRWVTVWKSFTAFQAIFDRLLLLKTGSGWWSVRFALELNGVERTVYSGSNPI